MLRQVGLDQSKQVEAGEVGERVGSQIIIDLGRIIGPLVFTLSEVESLECKDRRVT